jgi:predicted adenylyl cyclase CyaB
MAQNLEIKVKLESHNAALNVLKELNAEFVKEINQKDVYYKLPGSLLKLRIEDDGESMIKYLRDELNPDRFSDYEVVYFKSKGNEKFFNTLFETETIVEKKRLLYMYKNTRVHLDTVKDLGQFMEFETLVLDGKEDAKKRFSFLVDKFSLNTDEQIKGSYRDLKLQK